MKEIHATKERLNQNVDSADRAPGAMMAPVRSARAVASDRQQSFAFDRPLAPPAPPASVRFAPLAWLKLLTFLHADDVEVGGFGIAASEDLLYVQEFAPLKQSVTSVTVEFDDAAVADHFDACVDRGIAPQRCARIWLHSHPGHSPLPSRVDEDTFARVFGASDWSAMVIIARGGATYARLHFSAGPGGDLLVPVEVDWGRLPSDLLQGEGTLDEQVGGWLDAYGELIHPKPSAPSFESWFGERHPRRAGSPSTALDGTTEDLELELYRAFVDEQAGRVVDNYETVEVKP